MREGGSGCVVLSCQLGLNPDITIVWFLRHKGDIKRISEAVARLNMKNNVTFMYVFELSMKCSLNQEIKI